MPVLRGGLGAPEVVGRRRRAARLRHGLLEKPGGPSPPTTTAHVRPITARAVAGGGDWEMTSALLIRCHSVEFSHLQNAKTTSAAFVRSH